MTWVLVIALALVCLALLLFVFKVPAGTREAVGSALLLGIAGYALQGSPALPGAPQDGAEPMSGKAAAALVEARLRVSNSGIPPTDRWVVISDGLARNGRFADAAEVLRGAVEADPKNAEAWLAMANALVAHSDGMLTPAATYAYRRASTADPNAPGPPFFLGLALAQEGRLAEARALWADTVARAPENAPWREMLARQVVALDAMLAAQQGKAVQAPSDTVPPRP